MAFPFSLQIPAHVALVAAAALPFIVLLLGRFSRAVSARLGVERGELLAKRSISWLPRHDEPAGLFLHRLLVFYSLLLVFLIANTLASFYLSIADILIDVLDPGFISRTWSGITIGSPFDSGWIGSLPWYGQGFLPPEGSLIYHETWTWLFFSAGITDDSSFFLGASRIIIISGPLLGLLFILPLLHPRFRSSGPQSLFSFTTGMLISTRGLFGCFAQAWSLVFESETLHYGIRIVDIGSIGTSSLWSVLLVSGLLILVLGAAFVPLAARIDRKESIMILGKRVSLVTTSQIFYWGSLLCIVVLG